MKKVTPHLTQEFNPLNQVSSSPQFESFILTASLAIILYVILINAWVTEDAYITFRTLDNLVNGYGLTWNVEQRAQVFTHPLWLLIHVPFYWVTHEVYFTTLLISIVFDLGAIMIAIRLFNSPPSFILAFLIIPLSLSKAFIEYATSGLETPLTFFLLAVFCWILAQRERFSTFGGLFYLSLTAALAAVNRLDTILFYLPTLFVSLIYYSRNKRHWQALLAMTLGTIPLLLWELFSLFYYGFLFPNTAYAKLSTGLPERDYLVQGIIYAIDLVRRDPIATISILLAILATFFDLIQTYRQRRPIEFQLLMGVGLILYCLYVIRVGGDFMTGRFLAAPFFLSVLLINSWLQPYLRQPEWRSYLIGIGLLITFMTIFPKAQTDATMTGAGIMDERGFFLATNGLLNYTRFNNPSTHDWAVKGAKLSEKCVVAMPAAVGMQGFYAPKSTTIIDQYGITDPLLARLPTTSMNWRIGHFGRPLPSGYFEACMTGSLAQMSPPLARYYEALRYIISGPLFDWRRIKLIVAFNLGYYDGYLREHLVQSKH